MLPEDRLREAAKQARIAAESVKDHYPKASDEAEADLHDLADELEEWSEAMEVVRETFDDAEAVR